VCSFSKCCQTVSVGVRACVYVKGCSLQTIVNKALTSTTTTTTTTANAVLLLSTTTDLQSEYFAKAAGMLAVDTDIIDIPFQPPLIIH